MKALSIRAPWFWFIVHGGKDIENRSWRASNPSIRFRGPVLIHASKWWQTVDVQDDLESAVAMFRASGYPAPQDTLTLRELKDLGGHIVGRAEIVDVVAESASPWFVGPLGLVLRNAEPVTPWACKGQLGFFEPFPYQPASEEEAR